MDLPLGSRAELEQALDARTRPTEEDAACIAALDGLALRQAIYRASDALAVFDDVLLQLQDDSFELGEALEGMDAEALRSDNRWSEVLHLLAALPEDGDELRAVGLVKYRRYLRNRLEALEKRQRTVRDAASAAKAEIDALRDLDIELDLDLPAPSEAEHAEATDEQDASASQLLDLDVLPDDGDDNAHVFDQATVMHSPARDSGAGQREARPGTDSESRSAVDGASGQPAVPRERLVRLHRGRPVALAAAGKAEVEVWLARSQFRLVLGGAEGPRLVSEHGDCGVIRDGRSLVGRSPDCEIVVSGRHDTVSRVHLEVEVEHGQLIAVTDLSSGGTYVRPGLIRRRTDAA